MVHKRPRGGAPSCLGSAVRAVLAPPVIPTIGSPTLWHAHLAGAGVPAIALPAVGGGVGGAAVLAGAVLPAEGQAHAGLRAELAALVSLERPAAPCARLVDAALVLARVRAVDRAGVHLDWHRLAAALAGRAVLLRLEPGVLLHLVIVRHAALPAAVDAQQDRKSTRLNSSH